MLDMLECAEWHGRGACTVNTRVEEQWGNLQNGCTIEALQLSCKGLGHWENDQGKGRGGISANLPLNRRQVAVDGARPNHVNSHWLGG